MAKPNKICFWLLVALCVWLTACHKPQPEVSEFIGTDVSGAAFGGALDLTDHHGQARTLKDFRGKLVALFFGYTHCPDVCPTTMDDLAKALKLLGDKRDEVQVLFVTVDPERDTQQVLAQYVPAFDSSFLGLYGNPEAVAAVARDFKVFYQKQSSGSKAGYSVDHSAGVYVFDKKGQLRLYLNYGQKPQDIAHDLRLLANEKK
jgi:protein SCO1